MWQRYNYIATNWGEARLFWWTDACSLHTTSLFSENTPSSSSPEPSTWKATWHCPPPPPPPTCPLWSCVVSQLQPKAGMHEYWRTWMKITNQGSDVRIHMAERRRVRNACAWEIRLHERGEGGELCVILLGLVLLETTHSAEMFNQTLLYS